MNNSETWSVKVNSEIKEKINEMADQSSYENRGEFVEHLLQLYKMDVIKAQAPSISSDLETLQTINKQIVNIFSSMGEKMIIALRDKDQSYQEEVETRDQSISKLKEQLQNIKEKNHKKETELKTDLQEKKSLINSQEEQLSEIDTKLERANELNKSNNKVIEKLETENMLLKSTVAELEEKVSVTEALEIKLKEKTEEEAKLVAKIADLELKLEASKETLLKLKEDHKADLVNIKSKYENEKEKALLALEKQYQNQIQELRDTHNEKVTNLLERIEKMGNE